MKKISESDEEIRANESLFKLNINDENVSEIVKFLVKSEKMRAGLRAWDL